MEGGGEEGDPGGGVEEDLQDHGQDPPGALLLQVLHSQLNQAGILVAANHGAFFFFSCHAACTDLLTTTNNNNYPKLTQTGAFLCH